MTAKTSKFCIEQNDQGLWEIKVPATRRRAITRTFEHYADALQAKQELLALEAKLKPDNRYLSWH